MDAIGLAEQIRSFNRFYTEAIGSLDDRHEGLPVNLAQARMLFTISQLDDPQVTDVGTTLRLDLAYTSRVLGLLEQAKLVRRFVSSSDRRARVVRLTPKGVRLLAEIERRSNDRALALVAELDDDELGQMLNAMHTVQRLLTNKDRHVDPD